MKYIEAGSLLQLDFEFSLNGSYVAPQSPTVRVYNSAGVLQTTLALTTTSTLGKYTVGLTTTGYQAGTYNAWAAGVYNGANIFSTSPELFEVLTPSTEVYYASVTDLRDYLGLSHTSEDARLFEYIVAASRYIDTYCSRRFRQYSNTYTRYHEAPQQLTLPEYPVISISEITVTAVSNSKASSLPSSSYVVDYDIGRIRFLESYTGIFTITYTAGVASVPPPVRFACLKLCSFYYNKRRREGIKHESLLSYSYTLEPALKEELASLLDPYKLITL